MFDSLMVPIDGSEFSAHAVPIAGAIARASDASVRVVGVARDDGELAWVSDHVRDAASLLPSDISPRTEVYIDGDPVGVLRQLVRDASCVACLATHDHLKPATQMLHSVGSQLIERAPQPVLAVGAKADAATLADDVVVAVDGVGDPDPLLAVATAWASRLQAPLRIVTVYEPVLPDLRRPAHFTRRHGPPLDADDFVEALRRRADEMKLANVGVTATAIPDPVSVAAGLTSYLEGHPALMLVAGSGHRAGVHVRPGVVRDLLRVVALPVLIVNRQES